MRGKRNIRCRKTEPLRQAFVNSLYNMVNQLCPWSHILESALQKSIENELRPRCCWEFPSQGCWCYERQREGLLRFARSNNFLAKTKLCIITISPFNWETLKISEILTHYFLINIQFCKSKQPPFQNDEKCMHLLHAKREGSTGKVCSIMRKLLNTSSRTSVFFENSIQGWVQHK